MSAFPDIIPQPFRDDATAKMVSIDDIIKEALKILDDFRKADIPNDDESLPLIDEYFSNMRKEHHDFVTNHPMVATAMIRFRSFSVKALHKYLDYMKYHPAKDEDDFLNNQAHYMVLLYRETCKGRPLDTAEQRIRKQTYDILKDERKSLRKKIEELGEEYDDLDKKDAALKRKNLAAAALILLHRPVL